jgi:type IV pilus assembly protein PilY1
MNTQTSKSHSTGFHRALTFLVLAIGIPVTGSAADLDISDNALEVVLGVEPNVMILADDSGSMGWGIMSSETRGIANIGGVSYYYVHPDPGASGQEPATNAWDSGKTVPTEEQIIADGGATAPYGGIWRYWNSVYNKVYYDPDLTYPLWKGVDNNEDAYTAADPEDAPYDPYYPGNGTLDLTATISYSTNSATCGLTGCTTTTVNNFYPARYYVWTDTNGDEIIDASDAHTLVEIKSSTTSYPGRKAPEAGTGKGRDDCTNNGDGTATCTYAQEIQNFANWFTYYRKRDLVAKSAFSFAIEPVETARIGIASINNLTNASAAIESNLGVASMNISTSSGNKKILLDRLFKTRPLANTPLRMALRNAGKYFKCESGNIINSGGTPGVGTNCPIQGTTAGQCQQNYTLLMTDGYWNGPTDPGVSNSDDEASDTSFGDDFSNAGVPKHWPMSPWNITKTICTPGLMMKCQPPGKILLVIWAARIPLKLCISICPPTLSVLVSMAQSQTIPQILKPHFHGQTQQMVTMKK